MTSSQITYVGRDSNGTVIFSEKVIAHFVRFRQVWPCQREAGGQLFARFEGSTVMVEDVSGPRPTDRRSRTSYIPDRAAEQREIDERFARGLHFVGDWHTHPDKRPQPSVRDTRSIEECVSRSAHSLKGFLLVIVGNDPPPRGLRVSLHSATAHILLKPVDEE